MIYLICFVNGMLTEFASNVAVCTMLMPIVAAMVCWEVFYCYQLTIQIYNDTIIMTRIWIGYWDGIQSSLSNDSGRSDVITSFRFLILQIPLDLNSFTFYQEYIRYTSAQIVFFKYLRVINLYINYNNIMSHSSHRYILEHCWKCWI